MRKTKFILTLILLQGLLFAQTWKPLGPFKYLNKDASTPNSIGNGAIYSVNARPDNPNIIFSGSHSGGLWKSTDGGSHWAACDNGFEQISGIYAIEFENTDPEVMFVTTEAGRPVNGLRYSGGIFRSLDGGSSFQEVNTGFNLQFDGTIIKGLALDRATSFPNGRMFTLKQWVTYSSAIGYLNTELYTSSNSGNSWSLINTFPSSLSSLAGGFEQNKVDIEIDPTNGNYLYIASKS